MKQADNVRRAMIAGFEQARANPEMTVEDFERDMISLQEQIGELKTWQLRLLAGRGTWLDRLRLRRSENG